jgi:S1-C subfamily serine protease
VSFGSQSVGMCLQGFKLQDVTNAALKESLGLQPNQTGCLVTRVAPWSNAVSQLHPQDVVLEIDGEPRSKGFVPRLF